MEIKYSNKAIKFLEKQNKINQRRIIEAIQNLPCGNVKKMVNRPGYRLRVGNFRIIFSGNGNIIDIIDIGNRGQIYKN